MRAGHASLWLPPCGRSRRGLTAAVLAVRRFAPGRPGHGVPFIGVSSRARSSRLRARRSLPLVGRRPLSLRSGFPPASPVVSACSSLRLRRLLGRSLRSLVPRAFALRLAPPLLRRRRRRSSSSRLLAARPPLCRLLLAPAVPPSQGGFAPPPRGGFRAPAGALTGCALAPPLGLARRVGALSARHSRRKGSPRRFAALTALRSSPGALSRGVRRLVAVFLAASRLGQPLPSPSRGSALPMCHE